MESFSYKLKRSNRKTLSISVTDEGVIVRAPKRCSLAYINDFIQSKERWIYDKLSKKAAVQSLVSNLSDNEVIIDGQKLTLSVPFKTKTERANFYAYYEQKLIERAQELAMQFNYQVSSFNLSNAKNLWGVCTGDNRIRLNKRLAMLPAHIRDYVIFHELAHTKHHNHSARFWKEVIMRVPDCKRIRAELREYSWILKTYR